MVAAAAASAPNGPLRLSQTLRRLLRVVAAVAAAAAAAAAAVAVGVADAPARRLAVATVRAAIRT